MTKVKPHSELIEYLDRRFNAIDKRMDATELCFGMIDRRFAGIDVRFEAVDARFAGMDVQIEELRRQIVSINRILQGSDS